MVPRLTDPTPAAQINPKMPRTFGDAIIHKSHFDFAVEVNEDLPQHGTGEISAVEKKIGKLIAENLVKDGATLQMGIGSIPDAVLAALHNHKDLGIHSEMFANGVVELVRKGCVTNSKKKMHQGRIVGSFLIGDQALYDFVNDNPFIGKQFDAVEVKYFLDKIIQLPSSTFKSFGKFYLYVVICLYVVTTIFL